MIACPTCGELYPEADCNVHVCSHSVAQEWQLRVAAAQAGASAVCGSESLHCETARRLRERVRELERIAAEKVVIRARQSDMLHERIRELEARADKAEADLHQALADAQSDTKRLHDDKMRYFEANIRLEADRGRLEKAVCLLNSMVLGGERHSDVSRAVVREALKEATDGR